VQDNTAKIKASQTSHQPLISNALGIFQQTSYIHKSKMTTTPLDEPKNQNNKKNTCIICDEDKKKPKKFN